MIMNCDKAIMNVLFRSEDRLDTQESVDSVAITGDGANIDGRRMQR